MNIIHPRLLFTVLAMTAGAFLPDVFSVLSNTQLLVLKELPIVLFVLVIFLSHFFKQGRSGFIALVMMLAYLFIQSRLQVPLSVGSTRFEYYFLVLVTPLNLLFFSLSPERSLFSKKGLWYSGFLAWQVVIFYWLVSPENVVLMNQLLTTLEPWLTNSFEFTPLPSLLIGFLLCCALVSAMLLIYRNLSSDQAALGGLLAIAITMVQFNQNWISIAMFVMSALFLLFSVLHRSHEQAFIDELTLIPGRRALNSDMIQLGSKYTIAMMDIDHFKKFNDTYGHDIGDNVLKMVATQLAKVKGRGKVYRYGGEEFTVLFKNKYAEQCIDDLEEIRELVAQYPFRVRNNKSRPDSKDEGSKLRANKSKNDNQVQVTISIGVAERNSDATDPDAVIKLADEQLYKAKKKGRNCVCY